MHTIIWDLDGTILDSREGILASYNFVIQELSLHLAPDIDMLSFIGPSPQNIFSKYFNLSTQESQDATDLFREEYKKNQWRKAFAYDGIYDVLNKFKELGYIQCVATNKRQDYALLMCEYFKINSYCTPIYGTDARNTLTKADLISCCLKDLHVTDKHRATMIGDTLGDKEAAQRAGVSFLGVNYGFGVLNESYSIESPHEILKYFN